MALPVPSSHQTDHHHPSRTHRSRQEIERDYYREWERTTLVAREVLDRPMTIFTFLAFLPTWFKFYGLPGPVRFALYLLSRRVAVVAHTLHRRAVLQGVRLDSELIRRGGLPKDTLSTRLVMLRYHHRVPVLETIKFRVALLRGQMYEPKVLPAPERL